MEVFVNNLPCVGDNIRYDPTHNRYWLGCMSKRAQPFSMFDFLGPYPAVRRLLAKMIPIEWIINIVPKYLLWRAVSLSE